MLPHNNYMHIFFASLCNIMKCCHTSNLGSIAFLGIDGFDCEDIFLFVPLLLDNVNESFSTSISWPDSLLLDLILCWAVEEVAI